MSCEARHSRQTVTTGNHIIQSLEYADSSARTGATGLTSDDIGRVAHQLDNDTFWILVDNSPVTWREVGSSMSGFVPTSRNLTAGAGLTGGGDLSADRTFNVIANADGSTTVNANDIQVGVLASDAQHGVRGGGTQHAVATVAVAGFMSSADKTKLDGIAAGAQPDPIATLAEATGDTSDTSATDVLMASMTLTPAAGTYLVLFTGSVESSSAGASVFISIYSGGVQVGASEREFRRPGLLGGSTAGSFACVAKVVVNGAQAIEGRWRTTAGTMTAHERTLAILEVN